MCTCALCYFCAAARKRPLFAISNHSHIDRTHKKEKHPTCNLLCHIYSNPLAYTYIYIETISSWMQRCGLECAPKRPQWDNKHHPQSAIYPDGARFMIYMRALLYIYTRLMMRIRCLRCTQTRISVFRRCAVLRRQIAKQTSWRRRHSFRRIFHRTPNSYNEFAQSICIQTKWKKCGDLPLKFMWDVCGLIL